MTVTKEELHILVNRIGDAIKMETACIKAAREAARQAELSRGLLRAAQAALSGKLKEMEKKLYVLQLHVWEPNHSDIATYSKYTKHPDPVVVALRYMRWVNWYAGQPGGVDCAIKKIVVYESGNEIRSIAELRFSIKKRTIRVRRFGLFTPKR